MEELDTDAWINREAAEVDHQNNLGAIQERNRHWGPFLGPLAFPTAGPSIARRDAAATLMALATAPGLRPTAVAGRLRRLPLTKIFFVGYLVVALALLA